jgi:glycosidase
MIIYYFHVTKDSRIKYYFEENLFAVRGNIIVPDFRTARLLSEKINTVRRNEGKFELQVTAGQINALGLLHEVFHLLLRSYEENNKQGIFKDSIEYLTKNLSEEELNKTLLKFVEEFPPLPVYQNKLKPDEYLKGYTENKSNREIILEELIILNLENINPATHQLKELYTDEKLAAATRYKEIIEQTELFFEKEPKIGRYNLIAFLRKPIIQSPYNIEEQLDFIRTQWKDFIDIKLLEKLLAGKDLIREDFKLFVKHGGGEKGTPPVPSYEFNTNYFESLKAKLAAGRKLSPEEYEYYQLEVKRFTEDIDWMPRVVMIAKNAYVWLFQLSKKYGREIKTLDQIPDEELDRLARWNFTALWLIGIWERSSASRKIKQMMGNPEAASSAYSLYDYVIANELGGEPAFENLKSRAWKRGIRLSSDMVPNHTGIYSKWVVEKPDYFIQSDYPPFPNYKFTGPNLSDDYRVEVRIEDQYYSKTDAAVVFERLDRYTGNKIYIYHGNDGTNMPWNDTAQLNLMKPEVRESLIQTIMHVARKTPIIRFDAAMTLAKKHYQRLWFPIPGSGGAIPSRADYALTRSQFDAQMPNEFWREVVDRINAEMPNTLLLAEAFWLMEGYFVRTLGMHRVYNSAFMHMFMKEENEKYRLLIKNTLAFNPEILKRYVNFMSNPDEETAINQFGKGDKYLGVATMLVTLPGLPMFAHGQIEGFSEKYGMEYKRAYYDEFADEHLVWLHEKEIFPLVKKRHLFSQVDNFEFYDFIDQHGNCNQNVFAFTNRSGNDSALVIYNNSYSEASGRINYSCEKAYGEEGRTNTTTIDKALKINSSYGYYYIFRDHIQQLEYLVSGQEIVSEGMFFHLMGYQKKVLLDFREVSDFDGGFKNLYNQLNGRGVESIDKALKEQNFATFHNSLVNFFTSIKFSRVLLSLDIENKDEIELPDFKDEIFRILKDLSGNMSLKLSEQEILNKIESDISHIKDFNSYFLKIVSSKRVPNWSIELRKILFEVNDLKRKQDLAFTVLIKVLFRILNSIEENNNIKSLFEKLILWKPIYEIFGFLKYDDFPKQLDLIKALYHHHDVPSLDLVNTKPVTAKKNMSTNEFLTRLLTFEAIKEFLLINDYEGVSYFNKERIEELLKYFLILSCLEVVTKKDKKLSGVQVTNQLKKMFEVYSEILKAINSSGYKVVNLISIPEVRVVKKKAKKATKKDTRKRVSVKNTTKTKKKAKNG